MYLGQGKVHLAVEKIFDLLSKLFIFLATIESKKKGQPYQLGGTKNWPRYVWSSKYRDSIRFTHHL